MVAKPKEVKHYSTGPCSVAEAAVALGVSPQRVRQLIRNGALPALRVGGRWLLDARVLDGVHRSPQPGRPLEPRNAWGLLLLAEGVEAPWLDRVERSRLRARLRRRPRLADVVRWSRRRAEMQRFRAHGAALPRIAAFPGTVRTATSATGHDLLDLGSSHVYVPSEDVPRLVREFALEPDVAGNVVVRSPVGVWPFADASEAGPATVAADLWELADPRSRRAADRLFDELLAQRRYELGRARG
jgi:excisionase family DNA binding protein